MTCKDGTAVHCSNFHCRGKKTVAQFLVTDARVVDRQSAELAVKNCRVTVEGCKKIVIVRVVKFTTSA